MTWYKPKWRLAVTIYDKDGKARYVDDACVDHRFYFKKSAENTAADFNRTAGALNFRQHWYVLPVEKV